MHKIHFVRNVIKSNLGAKLFLITFATILVTLLAFQIPNAQASETEDQNIQNGQENGLLTCVIKTSEGSDFYYNDVYNPYNFGKDNSLTIYSWNASLENVGHSAVVGYNSVGVYIENASDPQKVNITLADPLYMISGVDIIPINKNTVDVVIEVTREYTAIFDANGGWFSNGLTYTTIKQAYQDFIYLPTETPIRFGYEFKGWFSEPEGGEQYYEWSTAPKPEGFFTAFIYAHWEEVNFRSLEITSDNGKLFSTTLFKNGDKVGWTSYGSSYTLDWWLIPYNFEGTVERIYYSYIPSNDYPVYENACYFEINWVYDASTSYTLVIEALYDWNEYITGATVNGADIFSFETADVLPLFAHGANTISLNIAKKDIGLINFTSPIHKKFAVDIYKLGSVNTIYTDNFVLYQGFGEVYNIVYIKNYFFGNPFENVLMVIKYDTDPDATVDSIYVIHGIDPGFLNGFYRSDLEGFSYNGVTYDYDFANVALWDPNQNVNILLSGTMLDVDYTFDANGGAFADGKTTVTQTEKIGEYMVAPADVPSREGYEFAGWFTDPVNGEELNLESLPYEPYTWGVSFTYYAHWTEVPGPGPVPPEPVPPTPVPVPDPDNPGSEVIPGAQTSDYTIYAVFGILACICMAGFALRKSYR